MLALGGLVSYTVKEIGHCSQNDRYTHNNISTTVKGSPIDFTFNSLSEKCIISLIAKLSVKHPLLSPVQTTAAAHHTGHEAAS